MLKHGGIEALLVRADALKAMGNHAKALTHLREALKLDPDNQEVIHTLKALKRAFAETERVKSGIEEAFRGQRYERRREGPSRSNPNK